MAAGSEGRRASVRVDVGRRTDAHRNDAFLDVRTFIGEPV